MKTHSISDVIKCDGGPIDLFVKVFFSVGANQSDGLALSRLFRIKMYAAIIHIDRRHFISAKCCCPTEGRRMSRPISIGERYADGAISH